MHWCQDETNTLMAALSGGLGISYICMRCKMLYYKIRDRKKHKNCDHK